MVPETHTAKMIQSCVMATIVAVSLTVMFFTWLVVPVEDAMGVVFQFAVTVGGVLGISAAVLFVSGREPQSWAIWSEVGMLAAVAIPALLSVGVLYLAVAALIAAAWSVIPKLPGERWIRSQDVLAGSLAFIFTETALLIALAFRG